MKTALYCKSCHAPLSHEVEIINTKEVAEKLCDFEVKNDKNDVPVPKGFVLEINEETAPLLLGRANGWRPERLEYYLNLDDILSDLNYSNKPRRMSGCCGPSGDNGPNRECVCGAEVGAERSDCWTYQIFIPLNVATEFWP